MAKNTIRVQTDMPFENAIASGAITPGMLLEMTTTTAVNGKWTYKAHSVTDTNFPSRAFAVEDGEVGNEITDAYTTAEQIKLTHFSPGDIVYALIANGENIAVGDKLVSNGDGYLKEATADSSGTVEEEWLVGIALEACDMSSSSGADPAGYCMVRVL